MMSSIGRVQIFPLFVEFSHIFKAYNVNEEDHMQYFIFNFLGFSSGQLLEINIANKSPQIFAIPNKKTNKKHPKNQIVLIYTDGFN